MLVAAKKVTTLVLTSVAKVISNRTKVTTRLVVKTNLTTPRTKFVARGPFKLAAVSVVERHPMMRKAKDAVIE